MIPIQVPVQSRSTTLITRMTIINAFVFLSEVRKLARDPRIWINQSGSTSARLNLSAPLTWSSPATHMFTHGGWQHLLASIWFLFFIKNNIVGQIRRSKFLMVYLIGSLARWADRWFFNDPPGGNPNSFFNQEKRQTLCVR